MKTCVASVMANASRYFYLNGTGLVENTLSCDGHQSIFDKCQYRKLTQVMKYFDAVGCDIPNHTARSCSSRFRRRRISIISNWSIGQTLVRETLFDFG